MKKIVTVLAAAVLITACNNNAEKSEKPGDSSNKVPAYYDSSGSNKMDNTIEKDDNMPKSDTVKKMDKGQNMYPTEPDEKKESEERRPRERRPRE